MAKNAHDLILSACRNNTLTTRGTWGMRTDCLLGGYGTTERSPCAVIDLARTKAHPTKYGYAVPIVLASGDTWEAVLGALVGQGEIQIEG